MEAVDPRTDGELLVATARDPDAFEASRRYELRAEPAHTWLYGIAWSKLYEAQVRGYRGDPGDAAA